MKQRRGQPRSPVVVLIPFCISHLLFTIGCKTDSSAFERTIAYPLVAYRSEADERVRICGKPVPQWLELSSGRHRAITGNDDYELWVYVDELEGSELNGRLGLQATPNSRDVPGVTFRLLVSGADGAERNVLAEYVQEATDQRWEAFHQRIGSGSGGPGYIGLQVVFEDNIPPRRHPLAAWIEPTVQRTVRDTIRPARDAPNVLLITADTTRQDDLACYGGKAATPALDALARDGILFSSAYSVAYGTTPSHASLLTACYAAEHGVYTNSAVLSENNTTLAEVLRSRGYSTAAFVSAVPVGRSLGLKQGFDLFDDAFIADSARRHLGFTTRERSADVTVGFFLDWIRHRWNEKLPFFVWIHLFDPHQPYAPPSPLGEEKQSATPNTGELGSYFVGPDGSPQLLGQSVRSHVGESLLLRLDRVARTRYRDEITFMDQHIGRALDTLKDMNLYQRTLVVFVSDHGENFVDRSRYLAFTHRGLYRDVTLLPFIVKLPKSDMAGTVQELLVGNLDIAPTILDIVGVDQPPEWSGRSFLPTLKVRGETSMFREHLVLEAAEEREISIRTRDWSYHELVDTRKTSRLTSSRLGYKQGQLAQLFDLRVDPHERRDLIGSGEHSMEIASRFHAVAGAFRAENTDTVAATLSSEQHVEALKALGYFE